MLIHGNDNDSSRKKLQEIISGRDAESMYFDGGKLELADLLLANEAATLLSTTKTIIIENFFKGTKQKAKEAILDYSLKNSGDNLLIFWDDHEVGVQSKKFPAKQNFKFDFPKLLFKFLDDIGRQKTSVILTYFHELLKEKEVSLIFALIIRQFRFLLMTADLNLKEGLPLASWQVAKFRQQGRAFSHDELMQNYRGLLNIDYRLKNGLTPLKLDQLIDIFLINL